MLCRRRHELTRTFVYIPPFRVERNQAELKQTDQIRKTLEEVKKSALAKDKGSRHGSQGNGSAWQNWQVSSPGAAGGGGGEDLMDVDDKTSKVTKRYAVSLVPCYPLFGLT
jgi:hypothetical protein